MNKRIYISEPNLTGNEAAYVLDCVNSGWISSRGKYIARFEQYFREINYSPYALSTANGTVALHLALAALDIGLGDEVLVPDLTFAATANVVIHCGAKPILVDIDKKTWCIDVKDAERKISKKTKAIIPVHLYGYPADICAILDLSKQYNLFVIEDCAEAFGAKVGGGYVGNFGHIGCFSFFANKIFTTGEGGMVVTNSHQLHEKMALLRNQGMLEEKRYWHLYPGYNYRMTNMQAAVGLAQLEKVEKFIAKRKEIFSWYIDLLKDAPGLMLPVITSEDIAPVCWLFTVLFDSKGNPSLRDDVATFLELQGIETRKVFYPLHKQPPYLQKDGIEFPNSIWVSDRGLSLPTHVNLKHNNVKHICECIEQVLALQVSQ